MRIEVRAQNVKHVVESLERDALRAGERLARAVRRVAGEVRDRMAVYPPEGPWNKPGPPGSRWYQRHFGPRWRRRDGSIGGRNTSEKLQKSWLVDISRLPRVVTAEVWTGVSYAPRVQMEGAQAEFHRRRGWKTDVMVVREYARERLPRVLDEVAGEG